MAECTDANKKTTTEMKKTLPARTPVLKVFQQQQGILEDETIKYVLPIFASTEDERYPLGSAVLLQIAEKRFLISAAHVFDENNHAGVNIEFPGQDSFVSLVGRVVITPVPSSNDRDDDVLDIAVLHLSDEHGISGGGLFRMGTFREINQGKGKIVLVGIPVTRKPKCLLATNITVALEMIRAEHPDLTREIPGSTYFKLGITKS